VILWGNANLRIDRKTFVLDRHSSIGSKMAYREGVIELNNPIELVDDNDRTSVFIVLHRDSSTGILITRDRVVPAKASLFSNIKAGSNSREKKIPKDHRKSKSTSPVELSSQHEFQAAVHYRSASLSVRPVSSWPESTAATLGDDGMSFLQSALNDSDRGLLASPNSASHPSQNLNDFHPPFFGGNPSSEMPFATLSGQDYYMNSSSNPSEPPWTMHTPGSANGHGPVYFHHHCHYLGLSQTKSGLPPSPSAFSNNSPHTLGPSKADNGYYERFPCPASNFSLDKLSLPGGNVAPQREEPVIDPLLSGQVNALSFGSARDV